MYLKLSTIGIGPAVISVIIFYQTIQKASVYA